MTPLIPARRAAEEFARVVDGSKVDVADRFADLTECVDLLRAQDIPAPRAEFVADLRTRLMAAADTMLIPAPAPTRARAAVAPVVVPGRRRERRLAAAAAVFVFVGGTAGVAAAAENSLPGDALYPIKRGIESAQVSFNTSDSAKGHDLLQQASTRLDEINGLMTDGDSTAEITHTLSSFERSATSGADLLFVDYQRDGDPSDLAKLRAIFGDQSDQLKTLAAKAPPTAQPDFASAQSLLSDLDQQARVLCGNCGPDSGDVADLTSAPALQSLLAQPAAAAAASAEASRNKSLADKAGEIASSTPKAPTQGSTDDATTRGGVVGGVTVPDVPTGQTTTTLKSTVTNVTGGVEGLIEQVGSSTGLAPVTTTVNNTLDVVTNLLVGK